MQCVSGQAVMEGATVKKGRLSGVLVEGEGSR